MIWMLWFVPIFTSSMLVLQFAQIIVILVALLSLLIHTMGFDVVRRSGPYLIYSGYIRNLVNTTLYVLTFMLGSPHTKYT